MDQLAEYARRMAPLRARYQADQAALEAAYDLRCAEASARAERDVHIGRPGRYWALRAALVAYAAQGAIDAATARLDGELAALFETYQRNADAIRQEVGL